MSDNSPCCHLPGNNFASKKQSQPSYSRHGYVRSVNLKGPCGPRPEKHPMDHSKGPVSPGLKRSQAPLGPGLRRSHPGPLQEPSLRRPWSDIGRFPGCQVVRLRQVAKLENFAWLPGWIARLSSRLDSIGRFMLHGWP